MHLDCWSPFNECDERVRFTSFLDQTLRREIDNVCREYQYAHIDLPVAAAKVFSTLNDKFNFVYVSRRLSPVLHVSPSTNEIP